MRTKLCIAAILLLLVAVLWRISGFHPALPFVRWTDVRHVPFTTKAGLEIASAGFLTKRSSVSLLCADDGVHLMAKGRPSSTLWVDKAYQPAIASSKKTVIILDTVPFRDGVQIHSFETLSEVVCFGSVIEVVTHSLNEDSEAVLSDWFRRGAPQSLFFMRDNTDFLYLSSQVDERAVNSFFDSCTE